MNKKKAVVLLQFGGPDSLDAVEPFLKNLFNDPDIFDIPLGWLLRKPLAAYIASSRSKKIKGKYAEMGGKSPIVEQTFDQQKAVQDALDKQYGNGEVYVALAMRYWKPFTEAAINELQKRNITDVVLLPLYAQFSITNAGSSFNEWDRVKKRLGVSFTEARVNEYYNDATYIASLNERIDAALKRFSSPEGVYILFSAHGTPIDLVKRGDPYSKQIEDTMKLVMAARSDNHEFSLSYQSKVGPKKWLEPSTDDTVEALAERGIKKLLVVPISFVSDHIETVYEIGIETKEEALEEGIEEFELCEGLKTSPLFIKTLTDLATKALSSM
jgi:ferrochelatase